MRKQLAAYLSFFCLLVPSAVQADAQSDAAFRSVLEENLPLSPDQIETLHKLYDITQRAGSASAEPPPTPVSSSMVVSLGPGQPPPVVRLSAGFVTSLVFVDSTGAPWPVGAYGVGNPEAFNIQWDQSSNAMFIQSMKAYSHGNLAIRLQDLDTPVMISLVSGQKEVDYRVDMQIQGRGPNAIAPIVISDTYSDSNNLMINILDGIPPEGSSKLQMNESYGQAWLADNKLYFRTQLTLLSPAWRSTVASPDGTRVYELIPTPLLLASQDGRTISVRIEGL